MDLQVAQIGDSIAIGAIKTGLQADQTVSSKPLRTSTQASQWLQGALPVSSEGINMATDNQALNAAWDGHESCPIGKSLIIQISKPCHKCLLNSNEWQMNVVATRGRTNALN
jgi:hypothetical protein